MGRKRNESDLDLAQRTAEERASAEPDRFSGGRTTRDDPLDEGAPMPGVPGVGEPGVQGPEDAGAIGEAREQLQGDYSGRQPEPHHTSVLVPEDEREEGGPIFKLVDQRTGEDREPAEAPSTE